MSGINASKVRACLRTALAGCAALFCCVGEPADSAGGSGSDTPNSVVVYGDRGHIRGQSDPFVIAGLYENDYVPYNDSGLGRVTAAGSDGRFDFGTVANGTYNVVVTDTAENLVACIAAITASTDTGVVRREAALSAPGAITGTILDTAGAPSIRMPVFLPGTAWHAVTDSFGSFTIGQIAEGGYRLRTRLITYNRPGLGAPDTLSVDTAVTVVPAQTVSAGAMRLD